MKEKYEKKKEKIFEARRLWSILLALIMLIGVFPVPSFAQGELINLDPYDCVIMDPFDTTREQNAVSDNPEPYYRAASGEVGICLKNEGQHDVAPSLERKYTGKRIKIPATIYGKKIVALGATIKSKYGEIWGGFSIIPEFNESSGNSPLFPDVSEAKYLRYIGPAAFSSVLRMDELKLENLNELQRIMNRAFHGYNPTYEHQYIHRLTLSNLPKLESIGYKAFPMNKLYKVTFSNLPSLKRIEGKAFSENHISSVDFEGMPNLEEIGEEAFAKNPISGDIDFRNMTKNVKLGKNAFTSDKIKHIYVKDPGESYNNGSYPGMDLENSKKLVLHRVSFNFEAIEGETLPDALKQLKPANYGVYFNPDEGYSANTSDSFDKWTDQETGNVWKFNGWSTSSRPFKGNPNSISKYPEMKYIGKWQISAKKEELKKTLDRYKNITKADVIADDGSNVFMGRTWVSKAVDDALKEAFDSAKTCFENQNSTQRVVDEFKEKLNSALDNYNPQAGQKTYDKNPTYAKPQGTSEVSFKVGEGVESLANTDKFYVKNGTSLPVGEFPQATAKNGFGIKILWSPAQDTSINSDQVFTASAKALEKTSLEAKIQEANGLLAKDTTSDPAKTLQTKVAEAQAMIQNIDAGTERNQDTIDAKAQDLGQAIQALKDLNSKKEEIKTAIGNIEGLEADEKTTFQGQVDKAKNATAAEEIKIKAEAKGKTNKALKDATVAVEAAEQAKTQDKYDEAKAKVDALENSNEKTALQGRLTEVKKAIDEKKAQGEAQGAIDGLTGDSITDKNIKKAQEKINQVTDPAKKQELQGKLDEIKKQKAIKEATALVEAAEQEKTKEKYGEAKAKVDALENGQAKTDLENRLAEVDKYIKADKAIKDLAGKNIADVTPTDISTAEDLIKAVKQDWKQSLTERLNTIKTNKTAYEKLTEATTAVEAAEQAKTQEKYDQAKAKVEALTQGQDKTKLQNRLAEVDKYIKADNKLKEIEGKSIAGVSNDDISSAEGLINAVKQDWKQSLTERLNTIKTNKTAYEKLTEATALVEAAEQAKTQEKYDQAKAKVDALENGQAKTDLENRLAEVDKYIKADNKLKEIEGKSIAGVTNDDISNAEGLINTVKQDWKQSLTDRLNTIKEKVAEAAVTALEGKKGAVTEKEIQDAQAKIDKVTDTNKKTALEGRLDQVKEAKKAKEKEDKAQGEAQKALDKLTGDGITDENIKKAQEEINKVTDPAKKKELQEKLNQIIAEKAVKELEDKKGNVTDGEIQDAQAKVEKVTDTGKKNDLNRRIGEVEKAKGLQDEAEKAVSDLEKPDANVTDEAIDQAKEKIDKVSNEDKKQDLNGRLEKVKKAKKEKDAQGEAQKALDKLTGDGITDENIKKAQEEIDKVTDPNKKQELQEKLNQIIAEKAVKDLEDKKGNVTNEEIQEAKEKINKVTDEGKKNGLNSRIGEVEKAKGLQDEAEKAVSDLEKPDANVTDEAIDQAKEKIDKVTNADKKQNLNDRLEKVKTDKKEKDAQGEAQKALDKLTGDGITDENIKKAQEEINKVTDLDKKKELQEKLNQIIAEKAVKELEDKKGNVTNEEIQEAKEKINKVTDEGKKNGLNSRIGEVEKAKGLQDEAEKAVSDLEKPNANVTDDAIQEAKEKIDKVTNADKKQNLNDRLEKVKTDKKEKDAQGEAQKALDKLTGDGITDENIKKAQEEINKVTDPDKKQELQEKLNQIIAEKAVKELEDKKGNVTDGEIQAAQAKVEKVTDTGKKTELNNRLDKVKKLNEAKTEAEKAINKLEKLDTTEKDGFKTRVKDASTIDDVDKIVLEAQKENAKKKIDDMNNLSKEDKKKAKEGIENAGDKDEIDTKVSDAQNKDNKEAAKKLESAKRKAEETINNLDKLSPTEKDGFKKKVTDANTIDDVNKVVIDAAKENAKKKIAEMDKLTPKEKEDFNKSIEESSNASDIEDVVNRAQGQQNQRLGAEVQEATSLVEKAEETKTEANYNTAKTAVDKLGDSKEKTNLQNRLAEVEKYIQADKELKVLEGKDVASLTPSDISKVEDLIGKVKDAWKQDLTNGLEQVKQKIQAKEQLEKDKKAAKEKVEALDKLDRNEKDAYEGRIDGAADKAQVDGIVLEAQKANAKKKIAEMDKLTPTEKENANNAIDQSQNEDGVNTVVDNAQADQDQRRSLEEKKAQAKAKVEALKELNQDEKSPFIARIEGAQNENDINSAVLDAQKANAKKKIAAMDKLEDGERQAADEAINQAQDENAINAAVEDANTKQTERKSLIEYKDEAKRKIEALDKLDQNKKDDYERRVDGAADKAQVDGIVLEAQKENAKKKISDLNNLSPEQRQEAERNIDNARNENEITNIVAEASGRNQNAQENSVNNSYSRQLQFGIIIRPAKEEEKKVEKTEENKVELRHKEAYIKGYPDGSFRPNGKITRAEAASMIAKLAGLDLSDSKNPGLKDTKDAWYNSAINAMIKKNLMETDENGNFRPDEAITRAEFARALFYLDKDNKKTTNMKDISGHKYQEAIERAYANGHIKGYPDGSFRPDAAITRAEAVKILNHFDKRKVKENSLEKVKSEIKGFTDLKESHWAYFEILVASTSYSYLDDLEGYALISNIDR